MIHRRGFTLIELVIVIAIIGILASLAIPKFLDISAGTRAAAAKGALGSIRAVLATRYAASATGGGVASYPTALASSDFAGQERPVNRLYSDDIVTFNNITALTATTEGTATSPDNEGGVGFWFVSLSSSADYGKAGAYSPDGVIDTASF